MVFLLALLSFIAVAAGVFGLGLGIPIRETWFGAALLMTGSVAVTGGFILVGLAAAVHELRQIRQGFKAPLSGMPRPVRPLERRDEERFDGVDGRMASAIRMPMALGTNTHDMISAIKPVHVEPRPLPILKSGVIQQTAYMLFTDGSIETQMPEGVRRFASIEEFLSHLEESDG
jgi:hypothetical protein